MNWLDIVLIVTILLGVVVSLRVGLLGGAFAVAGAVIGWLLAGQFSDNIVRWFGQSPNADPWPMVVTYAIIITLAVVVAGLAGRVILPVLSLASFGLSNMVNRVGGLLLGAVLGVVAAAALIIGLAGYAYTAQYPDEGTAGDIVEEIPRDPDDKRAMEEALTGSAMVPWFIDAKRSLPDSALDFLSFDYQQSLDILEYQVEERKEAS